MAQKSPTQEKSPTQKKADERKREQKLAMKQAIAEGRLTVRKMTAAERQAMEAHKAIHGRPAPKKRGRRRSSHA